ncbi:hypothetical protein D3C77_580870 [compost metagenome]
MATSPCISATPANTSGTLHSGASMAIDAPRLGPSSITAISVSASTGGRRNARNSLAKPPGLYSAACQ